MKLSTNIDPPSGTVALFSRVKQMQSEGADIISLIAGELDADTPEAAAEAGHKAIDERFTRYTPNQGIVELRRAIADQLCSETNIVYNADQILVTAGAKQAVFNILFAVCGSGDEAIILAPYYPSYPEQVRMCGATPIIVPTNRKNGWQPELHVLSKALSEKTRIIIVNSPNNPTGSVYSRKTWDMIAELVVQNDLYLLCDDVYDRIVYPPTEYVHPVRLHPDLRDRTLIANGLSKSMAMTGWRIGWAAGPEKIIEAAATVQSHVTNHPSSISQKAALGALRGSSEFISSQIGQLKQKSNTALKMLEPVCNGVSPVAQGAFYLFICVDHLLAASDGKPNNSAELALGILNEKGVAVVPGSAFGMEGYIRLSYSTDLDTLVAGLDRLVSGLEQLR